MKHDYETIYTQAMVAFARLDSAYNRERPENMQPYKDAAHAMAQFLTRESCAADCIVAGADNLPNVANESLSDD